MLTKIKNKIYNFLLWTEKWTLTDMIYLAKGGSWLAIGQVISMVAALLSSIAFANLLPAEVFGTYKYIFSFIGLLSIPTLGGLSTALIQAVARGEEGTLFAATKTRIRWGLLSSVGSLGLASYYFINHNIYLTLSFLVAAIFLPLMDPLNMYTFYLNGKKNFKLITKFNIINKILILGITVIIIWLTNNVWLIILSYFAANTIVNGISYFLAIKFDSPNKKTSTEAINYGKHLTAMNIISLIAGQLDKILIWHYLGAVNLAIYSFALAPIDQVNSGILKNTITLVMPKLSSNTSDILKKTLPKKIIKFTLFTMAAAVVYIIAAPLFYNILFPKYTASIIYSRFYAITLAFLPFSLFTTALVSQSQKKKLYFLSFFISTIKIILLFTLLPYFGITGAISALILTNIISHISNIYLFKKI